VVQVAVEALVEAVELVVIELLVMVQVLYKHQIYLM
tara:strand:+ start:74 stop:181 length:108 start_codon:yes stop_codon:yes gene_type:complete